MVSLALRLLIASIIITIICDAQNQSTLVQQAVEAAKIRARSLGGTGASALLPFTTAGVVSTWAVPANVDSFDLDVYGAAGATYTGSPTNTNTGGLGGHLTVLGIPAASYVGTTLYLYIGKQGNTFNGGGSGGTAGLIGGGATDVRTTSGVLSSRICVAGGGGGAGQTSGNLINGGGGGSSTGGNGVSLAPLTQTTGGGGGSQSAGGVGYTYSTFTGGAGTLGSGGTGVNGGGGGGGGYYGGGGGTRSSGGGGGSSFVNSAFTSLISTNDQNKNGGDGFILITYYCASGFVTSGSNR